MHEALQCYKSTIKYTNDGPTECLQNDILTVSYTMSTLDE